MPRKYVLFKFYCLSIHLHTCCRDRVLFRSICFYSTIPCHRFFMPLFLFAFHCEGFIILLCFSCVIIFQPSFNLICIFHISLTKTLLPLIYYPYITFKQVFSRSYDFLPFNIYDFAHHTNILSLIQRILSKRHFTTISSVLCECFLPTLCTIETLQTTLFLSLLLNTYISAI